MTTKVRSMRGAEDPTPTELLATDNTGDTDPDAGSLAAQEAEVDADEAALPESAEEPVEPEKRYEVQFVGWPPYGTEFTTSHTIQKSPATGKGSELSFKGQEVDVPEDLVFHRDNDFKLFLDEGPLLDALRTQPFLKVREKK